MGSAAVLKSLETILGESDQDKVKIWEEGEEVIMSYFQMKAEERDLNSGITVSCKFSISSLRGFNQQVVGENG